MQKLKGVLLLIFLTIILTSIVLAQTNGTSFKKFGDTTNNLIEKEILINENLAIFVRVLFGIKGPVTISFAIMIILIWLMMLIFLRNILILTPFFKGGISWVAAIVVNLLIALSGGMRLLTKLFLETGSIFKFLEEWTTGALIFSIILLIIIFMVLKKAIRFIKMKEESMEAEDEGRKVGIQIGFLKSMREWFKLGG